MSLLSDNTLQQDLASMPMTTLQTQDLTKGKQLKEVAVQFASVMLSQVFDEMEKSVSKSGLVPQATGESWYRQWLMDEYVQQSANQDFKPLVDMIENQLAKNAYGTKQG